ncbi:unnamed protein product (macronuclear) [Paramecium tetraurelia]|uniref:Beta-hexosaminidase n=1 Tax=Paramecium tetraurelia TaxID=5888 RepID=A0CN86_PARTE|nr:uncharacterized protein GSPATT00008694001 [Paramecium tetraurelia]CAK72253.1 unnamed protein product [Paramecium tetraurelia]|eukprot:XP_001439650.1 hypothetical protein (macronuclear) [Paramecium tetraurelia strain d4-2]
MIFVQLFFLAVNAIMPMPNSIIQGYQTARISSICQVKFFSNQEFPDHVIQLLLHYHELITQDEDCEFEESIQNTNIKIEGALKFEISIENYEQLYWVTSTKEEAYELQIDENLNVKIQAKNHWGLARALDTVNQLAINNEIQNLPIQISDEPQYVHRGIMIDTARNYLPVKLIKRTIDALVINKLNVLHWHITDDESFPLLLSKYSQITNNSKFWKDGFFTKKDVQEIIEYASIRAVQIIPEIDTPAHVHSWGISPDLQSIVITCDTNIRQYGQLDPTLDQTYEVLTSILQDLNDMFDKVQFIHFGGDEASNQCFEQKPSIKEFMNQHGISNYFDLQVYYRKKQKDIWKNQIKSKKKIIYWYNKNDQLPADQDDIIQWWGLSSQLSEVKGRSNQFILSDYHPLYLDTGVGNAFGDRYDRYQAWKDVYKWRPSIPRNFEGTILGGESLLWGETNNQNTHFQKLFLRSSILADTLWNPDQKQDELFPKFTKRLSDMEDRMNKYGFPVSPFTHSYCKRQLDLCFPELYSTKLKLFFMFVLFYSI